MPFRPLPSILLLEIAEEARLTIIPARSLFRIVFPTMRAVEPQFTTIPCLSLFSMMLGLAVLSATARNTPTKAAEVFVIVIPLRPLFLIVLFPILADEVAATTIP